MFLDRKNQYCENDYTTQGNLQIQYYLYQITYGICHRTRAKNFKRHNVPPINNIQQWKEMLELRNITLWLRDSHLNSVRLRFITHKYFTSLLWGWSEQDFVRILNYKNYLSCLFKKKLWLSRFLFFSENYVILIMR